jgi:DNA-binding CsgD family transcriptional regulator
VLIPEYFPPVTAKEGTTLKPAIRLIKGGRKRGFVAEKGTGRSEASLSWRLVRKPTLQEIWPRMGPRTRRVVEYVAEGYTSPEIAQTMGCSVRTVKAHLAKIYRTLGFSTGDRGSSKMLNRSRLVLQYLGDTGSDGCVNVHFSPKELTVLRYLGSGYTNAHIARLAGTTTSVVKNYLRVIYEKAGMSNRVELLTWYQVHKKTLENWWSATHSKLASLRVFHIDRA